MAFRAVLDADVLLPVSLRDTLLRLAELELYDPLWSERILREVEKNLVENIGLTPEKAREHTDAMNGAFEDAMVSSRAVDLLEPRMLNDEKDRHVLAAAVVADAGAMVTNNVTHFPAEACEPFGIEVNTADEFLCGLFDLSPAVVIDSVGRQAAALTRPPMTLDEVLAHLENAGAVEFAARVRATVES
jgi:hypothetical protein